MMMSNLSEVHTAHNRSFAMFLIAQEIVEML